MTFDPQRRAREWLALLEPDWLYYDDSIADLAALLAGVRREALEEAAVAAETAILGAAHRMVVDADPEAIAAMMQQLGLMMREACARDIRALAGGSK